MAQRNTDRRRLIVAVVVLIAGLCSALELAVRAVYRRQRVAIESLLNATGPFESYREDLGWSLNPRVVQNIRTQFGDVVTYRTGTLGVRVQEGHESLPADVDVLFVGDSVTFGTDANKSFPLEFGRISHLNSVNAGVPGYGTDQAFLMTKQVIETEGLKPRKLVYGFYWNDVANNVSPLATDFDQRLIVHKPLLDRETRLYSRAEVEKNDLTTKYARPGFVEACQIVLSHSRCLMATGRVLKYGLFGSPQSRPLPQFDQVAKSYLEANLNNLVAFVRLRNIELTILHVVGGPTELEELISAWLQAYCREKSIQYIRPQLSNADYLPRGFHLSDQGSIHVATVLWDELR